MMWALILLISHLTFGQDAPVCPPQINLPDFHFSCNTASDCAIAGDSCRSCTNRVVLNKKFLKEFDERDQLLRARLECSVDCDSCDTKSVKVYCIDKRCTLEGPREPATVSKKTSKKQAAVEPPKESEAGKPRKQAADKPAREEEPEDDTDSAALEKDDLY